MALVARDGRPGGLCRKYLGVGLMVNDVFSGRKEEGGAEKKEAFLKVFKKAVFRRL